MSIEEQKLVLTLRLRDRYNELGTAGRPLSLEDLTKALQHLIDDGWGCDDEDDPNLKVEVTAAMREP